MCRPTHVLLGAAMAVALGVTCAAASAGVVMTGSAGVTRAAGAALEAGVVGAPSKRVLASRRSSHASRSYGSRHHGSRYYGSSRNYGSSCKPYRVGHHGYGYASRRYSCPPRYVSCGSRYGRYGYGGSIGFGVGFGSCGGYGGYYGYGSYSTYPSYRYVLVPDVAARYNVQTFVNPNAAGSDYHVWQSGQQQQPAQQSAEARVPAEPQPTVRPVPRVEVTRERVVDEGGLDAGWRAYARGLADRSQSIFSNQIRRSPSDVMARVGYALASAEIESSSAAIAAMRRAFAMSPDAIGYLPADTELEAALARTAEAAVAAAEADGTASAWFWVASVEFLRHEFEASQAAVELAVAAGDRTTATRNLSELLEASGL